MEKQENSNGAIVPQQQSEIEGTAKPAQVSQPQYSSEEAALLIDELYQRLLDAEEDVEYYKNLLAERENAEILKKLNAIDPEITEIAQLGEDFEKLLEAGISTEAAYAAIKASREGNEPPPSMGDIGNFAERKSDIFDFDEVAEMSKEQIAKNYDKVMKSVGKWKPKKSIKA